MRLLLLRQMRLLLLRQMRLLLLRQWIERRKGELLPIDYYHVVFTIPEQLNPLALQNKAVFYKLLFDTTAATLLAQELKAH